MAGTGVKLAVFDCDGTLVDGQHDIVAAMAEAFAGMGLAPPPRDATTRIVGLSLPQAMRRLCRRTSRLTPNRNWPRFWPPSRIWCTWPSREPRLCATRWVPNA